MSFAFFKLTVSFSFFMSFLLNHNLGTMDEFFHKVSFFSLFSLFMLFSLMFDSEFLLLLMVVFSFLMLLPFSDFSFTVFKTLPSLVGFFFMELNFGVGYCHVVRFVAITVTGRVGYLNMVVVG